MFQLLCQVEQENVAARTETDEYEHLIQWLDMADQTLQVVDERVHDREAEFSVSFIVISNCVLSSRYFSN